MNLQLALIPLMPQAKLSPSAIRADFAEKWPDLPPLESKKPKEGMLEFSAGDDSAIVALMPKPIPWSSLEGPCRTAWLWPDAEKTLRQHAGHLIVTAMCQGTPLERAGFLTRICASILAACPQAPGVYWSDATLLVPSGIFQDFTKDILPHGPPLHIWVDFRIGPLPGGKSGGFTTGMKAFGHMEFETQSASEPPGELRDRFLGLANYVLENGPVIQDGDTIGEDANERIRVVYADSKFGHKGKVMRLEYTPVAARKGMFRR